MIAAPDEFPETFIMATLAERCEYVRRDVAERECRRLRILGDDLAEALEAALGAVRPTVLWRTHTLGLPSHVMHTEARP